MKSMRVIGILLAVLAVYGTAQAALTHHWALDETALTWDGATWVGVQESVSNTSCALWGYSATDDLTQSGMGVVSNAGPFGAGDLAYDFGPDGGISGVATGMSGVVSAKGDFTILAWVKTTNAHTAQGHIFSNNNNQAGRAGLFIQNQKITFWADGFAANGGPVISSTDIDDGAWHKIAVARLNGTFYLSVDGAVEDTAVLPDVSIDQTTAWMIGRMRAYNGNYEGQVADVKIYNEAIHAYVPEPATILLLSLGCLAIRKRR